MISSAINYMGSKRRLLKQIKPFLASNINTFYDLFAGSLTMELNVKANNYVANDLNSHIINLFDYLISLTPQQLTQLSNEARTLVDEEKYYKLREHYNQHHSAKELYLIINSSFNGVPRWNKQGQYNMPFASVKRLSNSYYDNKERKLQLCIQKLQEINLNLTNTSYETVLDFNSIENNDLVYLDPPYFITNATYNNGWKEEQEEQLCNYLEKLLAHNIRFAYSNVLSHNDITNELLNNFIKDNEQHLTVHHLNMQYNLSTNRNKNNVSDEILITNYE